MSRRREQDAKNTFTVDGAFLREQARQAVQTFFAPLSGVYLALTEPLPPKSHENSNDSQ